MCIGACFKGYDKAIQELNYEQTVYYHHVLEAKLVPGDGFAVSIGTEFIENENEDVSKNDCETNAFKRLADRLKKEYPRLNVCVLADSLYESGPVGLLESFGKLLTGEDISFITAYGYVKAA